MSSFDFITEFHIEKQSLNDVKDFICLDTTSPYLKEVRNKLIQPKLVDKPSKQTNAFSSFENKSSEQDESLDLRTVSEDKFNDNLNELSDEDFEDFGEIGIEILDFVIDKVFIFMGREPSENDKLMDKKKERLKIITGRLFKKWGVKFSLEMLGAFLLLGYINMRWSKAKKIEDKDDNSKGKVIQMKARKVTNFERKQTSPKSEAKKETPKKAKGLINIAN